MRKDILPLSILHLLRDGFYTTLFLLLPFAIKDLHIGLSHIGLMDGIISILGIVLSLSITTLTKKFDRRNLLSSTLLFYALSFLILFFFPSQLGLLLSIIILGIGLALFPPISSAIVARLTKGGQRGKDLGMYIAFGDLGKALFPLGVTFFAVKFGWSQLLLLYGVIALILYLVYRIFLQKFIASTPLPERESPLKYKELLTHRPTLFTIAASTLDSAATSPLFIFLPFLLLHKQIDPAIMGTFIAVFFVGTVLSRLISGRLTDKIGDTNVFILCEVLLVLTIMLLNLPLSTLLVFILIPILGIVSEGTDTPIQTMLSDTADAHKEYEKVFALHSFIRGLGNVAGPLIIGVVAGTLGIQAAFYVLAGIIALAIIPAVLYKKN